ncbi:MAG: ComF family protein [Hyphomicrobiaceae bacterium]|nr:ComF family protein [Hyphomicrobiaceae bacterium]
MSGKGDYDGTRPPPSRLVTAAALVKRVVSPFLDTIVPPLCLACHAPLASHDALCSGCWSDIDFIRPPLCDRLGLPLSYDSGAGTLSALAVAEPPVYGRARAVARHTGAMRQLIHDLKFRDRQDARRLFGRWLAEAGRELIAEADVLVPVPVHRMKLLRRRFNQAALLADELARLTGRPSAPLALERRRKTATQLGLTREQRRTNVSRAFAVPDRRDPLVRGRRVLLVDDVITTGATISAATAALLDAGAANVDVLALALVTDTTGTVQA